MHHYIWDWTVVGPGYIIRCIYKKSHSLWLCVLEMLLCTIARDLPLPSTLCVASLWTQVYSFFWKLCFQTLRLFLTASAPVLTHHSSLLVRSPPTWCLRSACSCSTGHSLPFVTDVLFCLAPSGSESWIVYLLSLFVSFWFTSWCSQEVAQLIKCLLQKHEDLSLILHLKARFNQVL